jgi:hypothetical protein
MVLPKDPNWPGAAETSARLSLGGIDCSGLPLAPPALGGFE